MTSREQFEVWVSNQYPFDPIESILLRIGPDRARYHLKVIQGLWEAWQASREAVEVEIPTRVDCCNVPFAAHSWNACLEESEKRIRAAGIKVKGE